MLILLEFWHYIIMSSWDFYNNFVFTFLLMKSLTAEKCWQWKPVQSVRFCLNQQGK